MKIRQLIILISSFILCCVLSFFIGYLVKKQNTIDFSFINDEQPDKDYKYVFMNKQLSDYICNLSYELDIDSDLIVAILMAENPEFNPDAVHKNDNGTIDCGLFQLNDKYLWTNFSKDYWVDGVELDPFNWKHNTFIAMHHIDYLLDKLKVQEDVIMAYNCGIGAVMNSNVPDSTKVYLAKVKNNLILLKQTNQ